MTRDDEILQGIYTSLDHMKPRDRRYRAVDHVIAARRALRAKDIPAAARRYREAASELKTSSNQEAHISVRLLEDHAFLIEQGN